MRYHEAVTNSPIRASIFVLFFSIEAKAEKKKNVFALCVFSFDARGKREFGVGKNKKIMLRRCLLIERIWSDVV